MSEQQVFIKHLESNPDDNSSRLIYADWLDDHDQPEEADRMRKWQESREWMLEWVSSINYGEYDDNNNPIQKVKGEIGEPHTYDYCIEQGYEMARGDYSHWGTDAGADYFREGEYNRKEWFKHWSILTGVPVDDDVAQNAGASCAC